MGEEYNGWSNWETWSVGVALANVEELYIDTLAILRDALPDQAANDLQQYVTNDVPDSLIEGVDLGVVDWAEIVESFDE